VILKVKFICIGKTGKDFLIAGEQEYLKRLTHYITIERIEISDIKNAKKLTIDQIKELEGKEILNRVNNGEQLVLLDENGKQLVGLGDYERSKTDPTVKLKTVSRKMTDENDVEVILDWSQSFVSSVIDLLDNQSLTMKYNSDPVQAHDICSFKNCHQINKGKVYKCPLVSVLPDFLDQFDVNMSADDRALAYSYE
jgi:hypothetical protein